MRKSLITHLIAVVVMLSAIVAPALADTKPDANVVLHFSQEDPRPEVPELLAGYDWSFSKKQYVSFFYPTHELQPNLFAGLVAGYERDNLTLVRFDRVTWGVGFAYRVEFDPFYLATGASLFLPSAETPGDVTFNIRLGIVRKF